MAFTLTTLALVYGVSGMLGFDVSQHKPFIGHRVVQVGHVVWSQVEFAFVVAAASLLFWRQGLRRL